MVTGLRALDRKLFRDLRRLRGQVVAIALVVASGVALMIMSLGTHASLRSTAEAYYDRYQFADVFARLTRAPDRIADRIAQIPGVRRVETRIVRFASLDVPGVAAPVTAQIVSLPEGATPALNALAFRTGRSVLPGRPDEVVIGEPFALAHGIRVGDRFDAILKGTRRTLTVVGVALSPEFVYAIAPGSLMPDDRHFAVLWMGRKALAAAFDLDGAFDDVSLSLLRGADASDVIARLDDLLAPYGGTGAVERADQVSNWFLMNELDQLRTMSRILPTIFLAVAAFLTNMVLSRLISTERSEIGLMKAFGYSKTEIAVHYAKLAFAICTLGILLGWVAGSFLGRYNTALYNETFRFPFLYYRPGIAPFAIAAVVSLAAALGGALDAVRRAATLPPAEAMRPPAPPAYRHGAIPIPKGLDNSTRIVLRHILRAPVRSAMTVTGVAFAVGVLMLALQWSDALDRLVESEFHDTRRYDISVAFAEDRSRRVLHEMERLPGVLAAEPVRNVAVRFRSGHRSHRGTVTGLPAGARLEVIYDAAEGILSVPDGGLVVSSRLAQKLGIGPGDPVEIEVLEGRRTKLSVPVVRLAEEYIGMPAWMDADRLRRLTREADGIARVNLLVDEAGENALFAALKKRPDLAAIAIKRLAVEKFNETMGKIILVFTGFFLLFAGALSFGVTYNAARIGLSERGRDLATLRVLGFTRAEISYILLGETALLVLAGLALGCGAGWALTAVMVSSFDTELFRVPLILLPSTYGLGVVGAACAAVMSAALVRRRVDTMDLIAVLKTRE